MSLKKNRKKFFIILEVFIMKGRCCDMPFFYFSLACTWLRYMKYWPTLVCLFVDRLWGEPVNLREQHDALEFFNNLVDNLDEGLKALSGDPLFSNILGGSFADQKICKGCPHRYGMFVPWSSSFLLSAHDTGLSGFFFFFFFWCVRI